jgi:hypothetical protein
MWGWLLLALLAAVLVHFVLRPLWAMRFYVRQRGYSMGFVPLIGAFGKSFMDIPKTKDIFHYWKEVGRLTPKPDLIHPITIWLLNSNNVNI